MDLPPRRPQKTISRAWLDRRANRLAHHLLGMGVERGDHVGVYAFRPAALAAFCALPPSALERAENLEQLRWLENGGRMRVLVTDRAPHGIDTPEDYAAFVERWRSKGSDVSPDAPHPQGAST